METDHPVTRRVALWLLFAATAIGLVAMHSLGHGGGPVFGAAKAQVSFMAASVPTADDGCAGDGCESTGGLPDHGGHQVMGPAVCQAVVEILGLLLALGLLLFAVAGYRRRDPLAGHRLAVGGRAPPRLLIGLTLSTVSVLRI